jgi:colanic acid biosynthesis glycosyl transferase WcaI
MVGVDYAPERTGIAPHTTGLAEHLARCAASLSVLAGRSTRSPVAGSAPRSHGPDSVAPHVLRMRRGTTRGEGPLGRAGDELSFLTAALNTALPHVPDLVLAVTPGLGGAVAAARIARRHRAPLIVVVHDLVSTRTDGGCTGRALRIAAATEGRLLRQAAEVAVVSPGLFDPAREHDVPVSHLHLLPHWTPTPPVSHDRVAARKALGWPSRAFTVVYTGSMGSRRDLETVIEAARLLEGQANVVLIGDGPRRDALREQARDVRGLHFIDPLDEERYPLALVAADLLLVVERSDSAGLTLPGKLTAYFGAGRAVLAAVPTLGAVALELERADGAGLVIRPGDPVLLAAAVRALKLDDALRVTMGRAGLRHAHRRLGRSATMHRLDAIVEAALGGATCAR